LTALGGFFDDQLMSFCDHCEGQRFDRARVLRVLRQRLRDSALSGSGAETLAQIIEAVRSLDIPHVERFDDVVDGEVVH